MSTTTTTTTAASATSTCISQLYNIPAHDAACAMPMNSTYHTLMTSCCGSASVIAYAGCDYYCLAQDQTVGDLAECLIKGSAAGQVWCNTNANATATGTATPTSTANATSSNGASNSTATGDAADSTGTNGAKPLAAGIDVKGAMVLALLVLGSGVVAPGLAFF